MERPRRLAISDGESLCVEDTAPEKPCTDFLRVDMKMSSTSGDDGLLDMRLVSESMVLVDVVWRGRGGGGGDTDLLIK